MTIERKQFHLKCRRAVAGLLSAAVQTGAFLLLGAGLANAAESCAAPANVVEVAPGAFVRHGVTALPDPGNHGAIANIGFIIGAAGVAVIDTGGSPCDGRALRLAIRERTALPIKYVINTHVHPDHMFGNAAFAGDGAAIIGHRNLPRALAERGEHYLRSYGEQIGAAAMEGAKIVPPTQIVADSLTIDLGGRELVLDAHPAAHTDNDLTVFDKSMGILWTGDLVFLDHVPVLDGSLKGWLAVTTGLMKHSAKRIVPGHGSVIAPWPESGEGQLRYLQRLAGDLREAIGVGKSIAEAAGNAGMTESRKWRLFDSFNARNAMTGFAELEWE